MKNYKVIKEFACAKKGDILTYNADTDMFEFLIKTETSERAMFMDEKRLWRLTGLRWQL